MYSGYANYGPRQAKPSRSLRQYYVYEPLPHPLVERRAPRCFLLGPGGTVLGDRAPGGRQPRTVPGTRGRAARGATGARGRDTARPCLPDGFRWLWGGHERNQCNDKQ